MRMGKYVCPVCGSEEILLKETIEREILLSTNEMEEDVINTKVECVECGWRGGVEELKVMQIIRVKYEKTNG